MAESRDVIKTYHEKEAKKYDLIENERRSHCLSFNSIQKQKMWWLSF